MIKINAAKKHRPIDPAYYRRLLERAGLSQSEAARVIGVDGRTMRGYVTDNEGARRGPVPYPVQVTLELLARGADIA